MLHASSLILLSSSTIVWAISRRAWFAQRNLSSDEINTQQICSFNLNELHISLLDSYTTERKRGALKKQLWTYANEVICRLSPVAVEITILQTTVFMMWSYSNYFLHARQLVRRWRPKWFSRLNFQICINSFSNGSICWLWQDEFGSLVSKMNSRSRIKLNMIGCNRSRSNLLPLLIASCALVSAIGHLFTSPDRKCIAWTSAVFFLLIIVAVSTGKYVTNSLWPLRCSIVLLLLDGLLRIRVLLQSWSMFRSSSILDAKQWNAINAITLHVTCILLQLICVGYATRTLRQTRFAFEHLTNHHSSTSKDAVKIELQSNLTDSDQSPNMSSVQII